MAHTPSVRPFPWGSLEAIPFVDVNAHRDVGRWAAAHVRVEAVATALSELIEADVDVVVERIQEGRARHALDGGVAVLVARADVSDMACAALVGAEGALAANVISRMVRRAPPPMVRHDVAAEPEIAGAFAAIVAAAARRAHAGRALRVFDAGGALHLEEAFTGHADGAVVTVSMTVRVSGEAFAARAVIARRAIAAPGAALFDARSLVARLGPLPIALPIVACATPTAVVDVAQLRAGDAFMPEPWPLRRGVSGALIGPVVLAAPASCMGLRAELGEDRRLVLRGGVEALGAMDASMDAVDTDAIVAAIAEVPVTVRVEVGEVSMYARDWAALGRGDVVPLGRPVGDSVLLRVEGVPLARGELVDVQGEIGVRIVERLGSGGAR